MIKNEKQYKITRSWIKHFEGGLDYIKQMPKSKAQPWATKVQRNSIEGQLGQLRAELVDYEALKAGKVKIPDLGIVDHLPEWLIKKRIAKGWTQGDLAERLKMHYQQIQRYESTDYAAATLETIQRVAAAQTWYVASGPNECRIGGTSDEGCWDLAPDQAAVLAMVRRIQNILPDDFDPWANFLEVTCGLRPGRVGGIRLEVERRGKIFVFHCYGHKGEGFTLGPGCAMEVRDEVVKLLG